MQMVLYSAVHCSGSRVIVPNKNPAMATSGTAQETSLSACACVRAGARATRPTRTLRRRRPSSISPSRRRHSRGRSLSTSSASEPASINVKIRERHALVVADDSKRNPAEPSLQANEKKTRRVGHRAACARGQRRPSALPGGRRTALGGKGTPLGALLRPVAEKPPVTQPQGTGAKGVAGPRGRLQLLRRQKI